MRERDLASIEADRGHPVMSRSPRLVWLERRSLHRRRRTLAMNDTTAHDEAAQARQALQESMDLRGQGHADD